MTSQLLRQPGTGERWVHRLAWVTSCATFVLLLSGGQVTSYDVGMAVPDWPTTFEQNMFTFPWLSESLGVFIEHRHRLVGSMVGILAIALLLAAWFATRRRDIRWLAACILAGVVLQGVLGGQRVLLNSTGYGRELAAAHGVFAQICFALMAAIGVVASRSWCESAPIEDELAGTVQRGAILAAGLVAAQVILGAIQRHLGEGLAPHILAGAAFVLTALWLLFVVLLHPALRTAVGREVIVLNLFAAAQVLLGVGAIWATGLYRPGHGAAPDDLQAIVPTLHLGVGALLVASVVSLVMRSQRRLRQSEPESIARNVVATAGEATR